MYDRRAHIALRLEPGHGLRHRWSPVGLAGAGAGGGATAAATALMTAAAFLRPAGIFAADAIRVVSDNNW